MKLAHDGSLSVRARGADDIGEASGRTEPEEGGVVGASGGGHETGGNEAVARSQIVVGVDGSAGSRAALRFAAREVELRGGHLVVLMVQSGQVELPPSGFPHGDGMSALADLMAGPATTVAVKASPTVRLPKVTPHLRDMTAKELGDHAARNTDLELWEGSPWRVLAERSGSAAMLVLGARGGGGFPGLRLGSVAQRVLSRAQCPIIVVRRWSRDAPTQAVAPVVVGLDPVGDFSSAGADMLAFAWEEALVRGAALRAVVAATGQTPWTNDEAAAGAPVKELVALAGLPLADVEPVVAQGHAAQVLLEASQNASLVVVGPGRSTVGGLQPGSVGRQLLDHAGCPVAVFQRTSHRGMGAA